MQQFSKSDNWKAAWQEVDIFNKNLIEDPTKFRDLTYPGKSGVNEIVLELNSSKVSPNYIYLPKTPYIGYNKQGHYK
jgi:hypothetical protein